MVEICLHPAALVVVSMATVGCQSYVSWSPASYHDQWNVVDYDDLWSLPPPVPAMHIQNIIILSSVSLSE